MRDQNAPMVSVLIVSYNHENYISKALDAVLIQKTNFNYEIVIGEDCSTDNTRKIILDYADKYPEKFKVILQEKNVGAIANEIDVYKKCIGKYIAICEGDDYWIDINKLQNQVDFLEKNNKVSMVFTNRYIEENGKFSPVVYKNRNYTTNDVLSGLNWGIQSVCYRSDAIDFCEFQKLVFSINDDRLIPYLCSLKGNIRRIKDFTAVYRMTGFGVATSRPKEKYTEIALEDFWLFHKTLKFPNMSMLTKGQMRYLSFYFTANIFKPLKFWNILKNYLSVNEKLTLQKIISCYGYLFLVLGEKISQKIRNKTIKLTNI